MAQTNSASARYSSEMQYNQPIDVSLSANEADTQESKLILRFIPVRPEITLVNLISLIIASMFVICFAAYLNAGQAFVLSDIIKVTEGKGEITGSLSLYDEILSVFAAGFWGIFSDRVGRRPVWVLAYLFMATGLFLYTIPKNVYPGLLLVRLLFSIGVAGGTSMLTATVADYGGGERRGILSGICGLFTGIGALIAVFGFISLPPKFAGTDDTRLPMGIRATYFMCGGIAILVAIILAFGLWRDPTRSFRQLFKKESAHLDNEHTAAKLPFYKLLGRGIAAARDPRIALAYIAGFVARGDSAVVSIYITLWVNEFFISHGACQRATTYESIDIKSSCRAAYGIASGLSGVAQVCAIVAAPIFGWLADRFTRGIAVAMAGVCGLIGCLAFGLASSPSTNINYLWMCLIGFGQIGMVVTSLGLAGGHYVPEDIRGSVAGVYSLIGCIGIMIVTRVGGLLFDVWWMGGPFVIMGGLHAVILLAALAVVLYERKHNAKNQSIHAKEMSNA